MSLPFSGLSRSQQDQYNQQLSSLLAGFSTTGLPNPSFAMQKDGDIYEKVKLDPVISMAMQQVKHDIAGSELQFIPGGDSPLDKKAAQLATELSQNIEWPETLEEFAGVVFTGAEYACVEYGDPTNPDDDGRRHLSLAGLPAQDWLMPDRIKDIDRRRVRWVPEKIGEQIVEHLELWSVARRRYERVTDPNWLLAFIYGDEEARLGMGSGDLDALYTTFFFKIEALKHWAKWVERWSHGQVIFKMPQDRLASATKTNEAVANDLIAKAEVFMSRHVAVIGDDEEYTVVEASQVGKQGLVEFINYCDEVIVRRVTGSLLPSGGGSDVGSNARGQVEERTKNARVEFHKRRLASFIEKRFVKGWLWLHNWPQIVASGLAGAKPPKVRIQSEKAYDPAARAKVFLDARQMIAIPEAQIREELGIRAPEDGEAVVGVQQPAPALGGFGQPDPMGGDPTEPQDDPEAQLVDQLLSKREQARPAA